MLRKTLVALFCTFLMLAAACSSGEANRKEDDNASMTAAKGAAAEARVADSDIIPVADSPVRGPNDAPVTIVAFSDFQCPFCARGAAVVESVMGEDKYDGKIRLVFKEFPLPFHPQAQMAARAAMAAGEQGKFWQMHDQLFANQGAFRGMDADQMEDLTAGWAEEMGLKVEQFRKDYNKQAYNQVMKRDVELGQKLGVRGTPNFFVNGVQIVGAQPPAAFQEVIDEQLAQAKAARDEGVAADQLYKTLVAKNYEEPQAPEEADAKPPEPEQVVAMVPVDNDDAVRGSDKALVTIVEFADFQCPFCQRVQPTLDKLRDKYGDKIRLVFKHNPLPFHQKAMQAAKLSLAAQKRGKFWQMHDLLFEHQEEFSDESQAELGVFAKLAKKVGMSTEDLGKALGNKDFAKRIEQDKELAEKVGARGTPTFFINGVEVVGAQPYATFEQVVDEQLDIAKKIKKDKGLSGDALYKAAVAYNEAHTPQPAEAPAPDEDAGSAPYVDTSKLTVDADQTKGPKDAKVTVFIFSDFQCPYCRRGAQNFQDALDKVDDSVRVIYKHYTLPFHPQAKPAAKAAMAAGEQGKFWQMHDLLFENQQALGEAGIYTDLAKKLDLDVEQFKKDMKKKAYDEQIAADMEQGQKMGVQGTPTFFIDGVRVVGAQPAAKFEAVLNEALSQKQ